MHKIVIDSTSRQEPDKFHRLDEVRSHLQCPTSKTRKRMPFFNNTAQLYIYFQWDWWPCSTRPYCHIIVNYLSFDVPLFRFEALYCSGADTNQFPKWKATGQRPVPSFPCWMGRAYCNHLGDVLHKICSIVLEKADRA